MTATTTGVDLAAFYKIPNLISGVAWTLRGYTTEWTEETYELDCASSHEHTEECYVYGEPEEVTNESQVEAVMVGDDRVFIVDVDDLVVISEDALCHGCGQLGCTADGRN